MNLFEREAGFEPANTGFADQPLEPLGHSLVLLLGWQDLNLRSLTTGDLQSPAIATMRHPNMLWTLVESNHVLRIFSPAHTPCLPNVLCGSRRIRTFGTFVRFGPLAEGWFQPLTHTSFHLMLQSYNPSLQPIFVVLIFLQIFY